MAKRAYGQYCGLAHALELVGERWALLIVRDLLVGPKRFTDLRRGLPRIPTNVLATRLKELEQAGVLGRRVLPRPAGSVVYELTGYGVGLEEAVLALSRWGTRTLGDPRPGDVVTAESLIAALRSLFHPDLAGGLRVSYELRVDGLVLHARVEDGVLEVAEGSLPAADLTLDFGTVLRPLLAGRVSPAAAVADGDVRVAGGRPELLDRFVELFHITPVPALDRSGPDGGGVSR